MRTPRTRSLTAALLALMMVLAACGDGDNGEAAVDDADEGEELALDLDTDDDAVEEEEEDAVEEDDAADEVAFDLTAAVTEYTETIPDGWMFVREVEDFEEILATTEPYIIDVRTAEEVEEGGVIPGSVNIDLRDLAQNLEAVPTDQPVYVYCATAWRAGIATSSLRMLGYDNVEGFSPGAPGWEAAGNELTMDVEPLGDFGAPDIEPEFVDAVDGFLTTLPEGYLTYPGADNALEAQEAGATLLDIRQPENFEEGYVADALTIPIRDLAATDELPTDGEIVVYCQTAWRTSLSMPILHLLGYENARGFPGGFDAWSEAGAEIF